MMTTKEFAQFSNEELITMYNERVTLRKNLTEKYTESINNLIHKILPDWEVLSLYAESMRIGFYTGKVENNGYRWTQDLNFYFGCDRFIDDNVNTFKCEMNTCCFGSFSIDSNDREARYYKGVGAILSNVEVNMNLRTLLMNFNSEITELEREMNRIDTVIKNRKYDEEKKIKDAEYLESLPQVAENLKTTEFALVRKNCFDYANVVYRKQHMKAMHFGTENEICKKWSELDWRGYRHPNESNYKMIETSKLKLYKAI